MPLLQSLLASLPFVSYLVLGLNLPAHNANLTTSLALDLPPLPLQLHPLPNPYPIPGTDITLDFEPHGEALEPHSVEALLTTIIATLNTQRRPYDRFPARTIYVFSQGGIEVEIQAHVSFHYLAYDLSYGDVVTALRGIGTKMSRVGVWAWRVDILSTEIGERIGSVHIFREQV